MLKMSVQYSKMCMERNELQIVAAMKFDLGSPKQDKGLITLNPKDEMISQFMNGAIIRQ